VLQAAIFWLLLGLGWWTEDLVYVLLAGLTVVMGFVFLAWTNGWKLEWSTGWTDRPSDPVGRYPKGPLPELPRATAARIRPNPGSYAEPSPGQPPAELRS